MWGSIIWQDETRKKELKLVAARVGMAHVNVIKENPICPAIGKNGLFRMLDSAEAQTD